MYYSKPPGYPNLDAIHDAAVLFVQKYQQQRQVVKKALRDGQYEEVKTQR